MRKKILISMLSTACMNPKLILDSEPVVIFTVKLSEDELPGLSNPEMMGLVERFRATYRNPEKVCVAETMEELTAFLEKWKLEFKITNK